jgi:hypothetical protein
MAMTKVADRQVTESIDLTSEVVNALPAANGGTGLTSPGTSNNVLTSNGSAWVSQAPTGGSTTWTTTTSAATSLTLATTTQVYVFTGSSATTWTLPALAGNTGVFYHLENRGTAGITVNAAGSDHIWTTGSVTTFPIAINGSAILVNDGTYWNVLSTDLVNDSVGILPVLNGGTGQSATASTPAASAYAAWDANSNLYANAFQPSSASTISSNTTLTVASPQINLCTAACTVTLPTTGIKAGTVYYFLNAGTSGSVTIQSSAAGQIMVLPSIASTYCVATLIAGKNTPTAAADWAFQVGICAQVSAGLQLLDSAGHRLSFPAASDTVATLAATQTLTGKTFTGYTETYFSIGTIGAAVTISLANGTIQSGTLTSATAATITMPTATAGQSFVLILRTPASGSVSTVTWSAAVKWNSGGAPVMTTTLSRADIFTFFSDGTDWFGSYSQGYTP